MQESAMTGAQFLPLPWRQHLGMVENVDPVAVDFSADIRPHFGDPGYNAVFA
jgi:hypothetical protein